jgi:hypothetical protein
MNTTVLLQLLIAIGVVGSLVGIFYLVAESRKVRVLRSHLSAQSSKKFSQSQPRFLTRDKWAEFEANLPKLKQVIVVSDVVDEPADGLRRAVMSNFARGVRYSFLISNSKADQELNGYIRIFRAIATIAIRDFKLRKRPEELALILALPDDWNNPPFVFYRTEEEVPSPEGLKTQHRTIAFRGDKTNVGIADRYEALDPVVGDALATALNSGAPKEVQEELASLQQDKFRGPEILKNVIPLASRN